jgi:hypothetical protein
MLRHASGVRLRSAGRRLVWHFASDARSGFARGECSTAAPCCRMDGTRGVIRGVTWRLPPSGEARHQCQLSTATRKTLLAASISRFERRWLLFVAGRAARAHGRRPACVGRKRTTMSPSTTIRAGPKLSEPHVNLAQRPGNRKYPGKFRLLRESQTNAI